MEGPGPRPSFATEIGPTLRLATQPAPRVELRPAPTLEFRLALQLLACPAAALRDELERLVVENPLLELDDAASDPAEGDEKGLAAPALRSRDPELDEALAALWSDDEPGWQAQTPLDEAARLEDLAPARASLADQLLAQLRELRLEERVGQRARFLIGQIDDRGYLHYHGPLDDPDMARALEVVQRLEPPGVGARDLAECLLLQWRARPGGHPLVPKLLDHLDDLAAGRLRRLVERLGAPPTEVQAAADEIRSYSPHPGAALAGPVAAAVRPDVIVRRQGRDWAVQLADEGWPRLRLSPRYQRLLREGDEATRRFLQRRLSGALWLLKAVNQRNRTLERVAEALVSAQQAFLAGGPAFLRPLTLHDVAETVGLHESTVSRAVSGKYADTPRGVLPLRAFLSSGGIRTEVRALTAEQIQAHIDRLIAAEDTHQPLSDETIRRLLGEAAIPVSRRTVAKYREAMGIPPSHRRRRLD